MPITVTISLFIVIMFASMFGTAFPLLLNKLKIDPALATGPFITLTNDIIGLNIYLFTGNVTAIPGLIWKLIITEKIV